MKKLRHGIPEGLPAFKPLDPGRAEPGLQISDFALLYALGVGLGGALFALQVRVRENRAPLAMPHCMHAGIWQAAQKNPTPKGAHGEKGVILS